MPARGHLALYSHLHINQVDAPLFDPEVYLDDC